MDSRHLQIVLDLKDKASKELQGFQGKLKSLEPQFKKMSVAGTVAFAGVTAVVAKSVSEFAKFEQAEVAFESMLGSADEAKRIIGELADFSAKTPFQFEDIVQATRTLVAFGETGDSAVEKIGFLGDISAGAQIPLADLAQIFGKVQTKGKAMTEEILQMSERGIPVIDALAEQFNVSKDAIFKMAEQGELSAEVVEDSLRSMTAEGGIFQGQMQKQSQTITGLFSTLKDNVSLLMASIGETFAGGADGMIRKVTEVAGKMKEWIEEHPVLTKWIFITVGAIAGIVAILGTLGLVILAVTPAITAFGVVIGALSLPMLAIIALIGVIIVAVAWWVTNWQKNMETLKWAFALAGEKIAEVWEGIKTAFSDAVEWIKSKTLDPLVEAIEKVIDTAKRAFEAVQNLGGKVTGGVKNAVKSVGSKIKSFFVDDAVITPQGQVIKTNPADYLFATKTPQDLTGGKSGVVINITGGNFGTDAGEDIGNQIIEKLKLTNNL